MWKLRFKENALFFISTIALLALMSIAPVIVFTRTLSDYEESAVVSSKEEVVENWDEIKNIVETELNLGRRVTVTMQPDGYKQIEITTSTQN